MKKVKLIYNSVAGQSKFKYFLDSIIEKFVNNNCDVSVFRASKKVDLDKYIKSIEKDTYAIIVAGGDGTINRVINSMMNNNIKIPLGVIPAGTSNDFARHIKMPKNFDECIDKILKGNIQDVDVGKVNDKYFINVCSAGLFTNTSQRVDVVLKNIVGKLSYFITGVFELFKFKPFFVKVETDDDIIIEKIALILVFNGSSVGGMNTFTENSSIQDGIFDIIIVKDCNPLKGAMVFMKILSKKHFKDENVIYLKESSLTVNRIKGTCDKPDVDGDEGPEFPMTITCLHKGMKMFL